ncbi:glycerol-3-phosphate 1-O-acyltransferase PlsY [Allosphingosinicella indica]|uniref:Glycerol-3-phosphate acyltransferase n=1 Tax=Allosphingosinicella indica TaxID=941907 RepID=A0A1X7FYX7_9SPHN|nr:glycerol-3-phosphate 1-O-acyltransferase PlsY [Allosphingosinicella indica]SMF61269.1 acyl-phosphate glycerol-3-phosphate acyltransferase [Allosphingosinicella indica]
MEPELLWPPLLALLFGYLMGSIPFGVLLTRAAGAGDLRAIGSGNIGATNVLRTGRKGLAALTLVLDGLKGAAAVLITAWVSPEHVLLTAIGTVVGHIYPVWLRFRGGKGVATLFGVMMALHWPSGLAYAAVWLIVLGVSRYSSLAGITAALLAPVAAAMLGRFDLTLLYLGFGLLVLWKHRANVERLLSGTEPRVGSGAHG